jgi:hypothetical protein
MSTELDQAPVAPLTRQEREGMNKLSTEAYGKRLQWQKMLRKGELRDAADMTQNGDPIKVKKLHHFTLREIFNNMNKIVTDNAIAAATAAAKALADKQAKEKESEVSKEAGSN